MYNSQMYYMINSNWKIIENSEIIKDCAILSDTKFCSSVIMYILDHIYFQHF